MPFRGHRCSGFEALPADVLAIILRGNADQAQHNGALSLAQAVQLLSGPCHHWSAVATAEVSLPHCRPPSCASKRSSRACGHFSVALIC